MGLAADIYADQLSYLKHGHPQWRPEPMEREPPMIGDLGHLLDGQFRRLFCCARPPKHELSEMSPRNFYQLQYDQNLLVNRERAIDPGTVQGKNVTVSKLDIYRARPLTSVDFSCSSEQGALLAMPYHASSRAVRPNREFIDYFKKNHELWFDDVINNWGLDVKPEDLILVRGYVKTTEFSLAAVCQKKYSYWFFPDLQIDTFRALAGMKFHPNSSQVVLYRTGPNRVSPYPYVKFTEDDPDHGADPSNPSKSEAPVVSKTSPASGVVVEVVSDAVPGDVLFREGEEDRDDGEGEDEDGDDGSDATLDRPLYADEEDAPINMVRDQTIFLKYYKLRRRLFFPEKIVAHGEPKDPPLPPDHNPNAPPLIPRSDSWEPLDQLLIYLLRHSSANIAIACDDDVYLTCEGHEWPNNFENFYEVTRPRIFVDDDNVAVIYREEYLPKRSEDGVSSSMGSPSLRGSTRAPDETLLPQTKGFNTSFATDLYPFHSQYDDIHPLIPLSSNFVLDLHIFHALQNYHSFSGRSLSSHSVYLDACTNEEHSCGLTQKLCHCNVSGSTSFPTRALLLAN